MKPLVSCKECHVQNSPAHAHDCPTLPRLWPSGPRGNYGQQFNLLDPLKDKKKKEDKKPWINQYDIVSNPPKTECICEVTAFGLVINDKCTYDHNKRNTS